MTFVTLDVADAVFVDVAGLDVVTDVLAAVVGLALPVGAVPPPVQETIPGKIKKVKINRETSFFTIYPPCIELFIVDRYHLVNDSDQ
jgi:hypothetical protein